MQTLEKQTFKDRPVMFLYLYYHSVWFFQSRLSLFLLAIANPAKAKLSVSSNKRRNYILVFFLFLCSFQVSELSAQIEAVHIETYYISDENDILDIFGSILDEGSTTYRIFVDLAEGCAIKSLLGSKTHPFLITSSADFFNYNGEVFSGKDFGYNIPVGFLGFGNMALDSWLTLGFASSQHFGILKNEDTDGSIIGGENNFDGMLINSSEDIGEAITTSDGLAEPDSVYNLARFFAFISDSIFCGETSRDLFIYSDSSLPRFIYYPDGIAGPTSENKVLIAQLTTNGELFFNINIEVLGADGNTYIYVGRDTLTSIDEGIIYSRWLNYPYSQGCTDPNFIEYDPYAIIDDGSCNDPIIIGCNDPKACNFDPAINKHVSQLCCYDPDNCDNRDITLVCPGFNVIEEDENIAGSLECVVYPNPASDFLTLEIRNGEQNTITYLVHNSYGGIVEISETEKIMMQCEKKNIPISQLEKGLYFIRIISDSNISSVKSFIKN